MCRHRHQNRQILIIFFQLFPPESKQPIYLKNLTHSHIYLRVTIRLQKDWGNRRINDSKLTGTTIVISILPSASLSSGLISRHNVKLINLLRCTIGRMIIPTSGWCSYCIQVPEKLSRLTWTNLISGQFEIMVVSCSRYSSIKRL